MALMIVQRILGYLFPLVLLAVAAYGTFRVFLELITFRGLYDIFYPEKLGDRIFGRTWLVLNTMIKKGEEETVLPSLEKSAYGVVVEIGPGSGNQLSRYDKSKIEKIYGVEPNPTLHDALRETIKAEGLQDVYSIVPCGIEDFDSLEGYGVPVGKVDSVMCVQVLCSVPRPQDMAKAMYKILKPGGQLILYEHVASTDTVTGFVQDLYELIWPYFFGNCHLRRPTGQYMIAAGKWETLDVNAPTAEEECSIVPKVSGRLIKSRAAN